MKISSVEKLAKGLATAQATCLNNEYTDRYKAYLSLVDSVEKGETPTIGEPWLPLEGFPWPELLELIEVEADAIEFQMNILLRLAKTGIMLSTIDGTIESDINNLDLSAMADKGVLE